MIAVEPASPVVPRRTERLSQPLERYSPRLFSIDAGEHMTIPKSDKGYGCCKLVTCNGVEDELHPCKRNLGLGGTFVESKSIVVQVGLSIQTSV
jgi:hypothetical protein